MGLAVLEACIIFALLCALFWSGRQNARLKEQNQAALQAQKKRLEEEYSAHAADKEAKLAALQAQINPHFLYNTLECIRSEALLYDCGSIAKMAKVLASFFRYSISKKENIVTIREELENIQNYFLIQSYRFEDKFSLTIDMPEEDREAQNCLIPKLSLQPIVENAIFHGLELQNEKGRICIRVRMNDRSVVLTISDNGAGMSREKLEALRAGLWGAETAGEAERRPGRGNGIALVNVHQRIRLIFGKEYGVSVYSTEGFGTDVELTLPVMKERPKLV